MLSDVLALDFQFTEFILAREIVEEIGPSPASGISMKAWEDHVSDDPSDTFVTWLLEPHRLTHVQRWSGTMAFTNDIDKSAQTINAFVHFAYIWSQETLLFADVQSTYDIVQYF